MNESIIILFLTGNASRSKIGKWNWMVAAHRKNITNEEVHAKIQQAIGPHESLLTIEKRRKLHWYGHVFLSSGLAKTILQSTVKGG